MTNQLTELTCKDCGDNYTEKSIVVLGVTLMTKEERCGKCWDKVHKAAEEQEAAMRQLQIARQRYTWRTDSGIPLKFMTAEFGNFDQSRPGNVKLAYKQCLKYAEGFPLNYRETIIKPDKPAYPSMVLMSPKVWGVGKTHLVSAIAHRIFNKWNGEGLITQGEGVIEKVSSPVKFITEAGLFNRIEATFSYSNEDRQRLPSKAKILAHLKYVDLLIIDDIGKEQRRDMSFVQRTLFSLIDSRYSVKRPVVLTTNLDEFQLKAHLGGNDEAILDRLIEMCGKDYFIKLHGESYRRK